MSRPTRSLYPHKVHCCFDSPFGHVQLGRRLGVARPSGPFSESQDICFQIVMPSEE
jgi:hypothetical protein